MKAQVLSIKKKDDKSSLVMLQVLLDGERQKYIISEGTYRDIGCPLSGGFLDEYNLEILVTKDEERRCMIKACNVLAYADNNERSLLMKLARAGFSRQTARETVDECKRLGYIDEPRQAERIVIRCSEQLFGPRRIMAKLASRGYSASVSRQAIARLEATGEIDFSAQKQTLLEKKLPEDALPEEKKKLLYRYGY